jgi:hypothetical protein
MSSHLAGARVPGNVDIMVGRVIGIHIQFNDSPHGLSMIDRMIDISRIRPMLHVMDIVIRIQNTVIERVRNLIPCCNSPSVFHSSLGCSCACAQWCPRREIIVNFVFVFQVFDMMIPTQYSLRDARDRRILKIGLRGLECALS